MSQTLIRNEDFKSGSTFNNVRGILYRGNGTPTNRVNAANAGAIYLDQYTGQLWMSLNSGEPATWIPYFTDVTSSVRIASDVQEGDLVGIYGAGSWSASGNLNNRRWDAGCAGSNQKSTVVAGGSTQGNFPSMALVELFNGSAWYNGSNINTARMNLSGLGSQNAGLMAGGGTAIRGFIASTYSTTEIFDGSTWSTSGTLLQARQNAVAFGTVNAGLIAGGISFNNVYGTCESFNGATWTSINSLNAAKCDAAGIGSQNSGLLAGGVTSVGGTNKVFLTEFFNGSSWSSGCNLVNDRYASAVNGSQNAGLISGGVTFGGATNISELFNGSAWNSGSNANNARYYHIGGGTPSSGLVAGGTTDGILPSSATELHTQSIYRKLNFSNVQSANNVGLAYNTSNTSLTASVMRGDVSGDIVSGISWFGLSRFNNPQTDVYVTSTTATISSISSTITNQGVLNLSTTLTGGFAKGGLLKVSNGDLIPIIGGTSIAPVVRWENVSTSASTSLTVGCVWGQRIYFDATLSITASSTTITFSQGPSSLTFNYQGRVGDVLYVPYSSVSGTNGSAVFYGTYLVTNVSQSSSGNAMYTADSLTSSFAGVIETNIGGAILYQQLVNASVQKTNNKFSLDSADLVLGFRNKLRIPLDPYNDDFSNGII